MSDSQSPVICVTCKRHFPHDVKKEDAPKYFAQENIFPRSDDDHAFSSEASRIVRYIESVTYVTRYATGVEQEHYETILELLYQLSAEANRRLELSSAAMEEIWKRDHGQDASMRKDGRA